ncbi:GNAT family N-acetyltransferase [Leisingera sp. ANG-Vp]|uniref:GNAT family N-acetyltransferase n=1 Tax=Leisingera sp. ANG-Vp TaxID=1577896 RepID=UPI00068B53D9|nr:GNAT family N-acetyltransferase [Leisingera sp. ANG-Vp]
MNTSPADTPAPAAAEALADDKGVKITLNPENFDDWPGLLGLLRHAFARTVGRVDPPSTVYCCTAADLAQRAASEHLMIAIEGNRLAGCLFLKEQENALFLGRFAIQSDYMGGGLARRMISCAATLARQRGKSHLVLETRTALVENQAKFRALGFEITGGRAHPGYHGITTFRMARRLDGDCQPHWSR